MSNWSSELGYGPSLPPTTTDRLKDVIIKTDLFEGIIPEGHMTDLIPTISPSTIRQAAVNTTYATVGGVLVSKYAFGGSILDGAKYGAGSYVAVAGAKTIYDALGPSPKKTNKPISPDNPIQKGKLGDNLNDWWRLVDENSPKTPNPPSSKPIVLMPVTTPSLPVQLGSPPSRRPTLPDSQLPITTKIGDNLNDWARLVDEASSKAPTIAKGTRN